MLTEFFLVAFFDVSNVDNGCGGTNGCSRVAGWNGTGEERMEGTGQGGELAAFVIAAFVIGGLRIFFTVT